MTGNNRLAAILLGIVAASAGAIYWIERLAHPTPKQMMALRLGIALLGALGALVVFWQSRRKGSAHAGGTTAPRRTAAADEALVACTQAEKRLRDAQRIALGRLTDLPSVVVLGPTGSGKTSCVIGSGIPLELLAGDVQRGDQVVPTRGAALWYANGEVIVEADGGMVADAERWDRLVHRLRKGQIWRTLRGRDAAPRRAIVCLGCDVVLQSTGKDGILPLARDLRERLLTLSRAFATRLPVYLVLTKVDQLPGMDEVTRLLTTDESRDVLGLSLPMLPFDASAAWSEREFARLDQRADALQLVMSDFRRRQLPRERDADVARDLVDAPQQLRQLLDAVMPLALELSRPSQLDESPFLRGIYFAGARTVAGPVPASEHLPSLLDEAIERTAGTPALRLVDDHEDAPVIRWDGDDEPIVARTVTQPVYLPGFWQQIVTADAAARAVSANDGGARRRKRQLLAAATLCATIGGIGVLTSFVNNRRLQDHAVAAARSVIERLNDSEGLPALPTLERLDSLRTIVATLRDHDSSGAPLRLRWGVYTGQRTLTQSREAYFAALDRLLLADTRGHMRDSLDMLASARNVDYGRAYRLLKAHLLTTSEAPRTAVDFLPEVLEDYWSHEAALDPEQRGLVRSQFTFYASELPINNPYAYDRADDARRVRAARSVLARFTGVEPIYQAVVADAGRRVPGVRFSTDVPTSRDVVRAPHLVPGAFTRPGALLVANALGDLDRYVGQEDWVLGRRTPLARNRDSVVAALRKLYRDEYIDQWRSFLRSASVVPFRGSADAAARLRVLSGNSSPLLGLFSLVTSHTAGTPAGTFADFQPAHVITPPPISSKYISTANEDYAQELIQLQAAMEQVSQVPEEDRETVRRPALERAAAVRSAAGSIAQKFNVDRTGDLDDIARRLLEQPADHAVRLLGRLGPREEVVDNGSGTMHGAMVRVCESFTPLRAQAPFSRQWDQPAKVDDVVAFLRPEKGALWTHYRDTFGGTVMREGNRFVPKPGATVVPPAPFLAFLTRAAELTDALYPEGSTEPTVRFSFRPMLSDDVPTVTLTVDGQSEIYTRTYTASRSFVWRAASAQSVRLVVRTADNIERVIIDARGPWALFELFGGAVDWAPAGGMWRGAWKSPTFGAAQELGFELSTRGTGGPVFRRAAFEGLACTSR
jgi:type VI secretion system protein ImpL